MKIGYMSMFLWGVGRKEEPEKSEDEDKSMPGLLQADFVSCLSA